MNVLSDEQITEYLQKNQDRIVTTNREAAGGDKYLADAIEKDMRHRKVERVNSNYALEQLFDMNLISGDQFDKFFKPIR